MDFREIVFRGRRKDNGEWVEGNFHHNIRKGTFFAISPKNTNLYHEIYRESLQMKDIDNEFRDI